MDYQEEKSKADKDANDAMEKINCRQNDFVNSVVCWMESHLSYLQLNDFAQKENDIVQGIKNLYINGTNQKYAYMPKNADEFCDDKIKNLYLSLVDAKVTNQNTKLQQLKQKSQQANEQLIDCAKEIMAKYNSKIYNDILKKAEKKFEQEYSQR